jgi:hypothetical protein
MQNFAKCKMECFATFSAVFNRYWMFLVKKQPELHLPTLDCCRITVDKIARD